MRKYQPPNLPLSSSSKHRSSHRRPVATLIIAAIGAMIAVEAAEPPGHNWKQIGIASVGVPHPAVTATVDVDAVNEELAFLEQPGNNGEDYLKKMDDDLKNRDAVNARAAAERCCSCSMRSL